jgi:hypothetical protein
MSLPPHVQVQVDRLSAGERQALARHISDCIAALDTLPTTTPEAWYAAVLPLRPILDRLRALIEPPPSLANLADTGRELLLAALRTPGDAWTRVLVCAVTRDQVAKLIDFARAALCAMQDALPNPESTLEYLPDGFTLAGRRHRLTGRPLDMLRELLAAPHWSMTADDLRKRLEIDDAAVTYPEQVVKDTAMLLRKALREATTEAGLPCEDPLPSSGRGRHLAYTISLP